MMLFVSNAQIQRHVTIEPIIAAVEGAFRALGRGDSAIFPVARGSGSDPSHFVGVKSGREGSTGFIGVKVGSYNPRNRSHGLPAHTSTTLLIDDTTAAVVALVEAGYLNGMRTAAANAVAARVLARPDSRVLGIIGLGAQAVFEIEALAVVRPIQRVLAASRSPLGDARFAQRVRERTGLVVTFLAAQEVVSRADILVTVTPATAPVLADAWVRPGTHVAAMGADNVGKMELPVELVARSKLYVDYPDQAAVIGESQHSVAAGSFTLDALRARSLGALLNGSLEGRTNSADITVFDSSGTAIQDIAAAAAALAIVGRAEGGGG